MISHDIKTVTTAFDWFIANLDAIRSYDLPSCWKEGGGEGDSGRNLTRPLTMTLHQPDNVPSRFSVVLI